MGSPSPSTGSSEGSSKPDKRTNRREKEKNRQRRYRQRLKDSRDELQRKVDELSKELLQLNKKPKNTEEANNALTSSRWISEAVQQREQRTQSEAEQQRLIAAVNHQAAYIKGLRQVVGDRLCGNSVEPGDDTVSIACYNNAPIVHSMTNALYTTYMQQLEGCYARVDNVVNMCGMITLSETTINTTHRRNTDGEVAYFQHVNKVAIPYSYNQVCAALWKAVHEQKEPAFGGYEMPPDDNVIIKSRIRAINVGSMAQQYISRFYKEEDRLVLVWKMSSEGEGAFSGLHAEETSWMCVRPTPTRVMLEVCAQQVPMRFKVAHDLEPATSKFHNMLHEYLEADKVEMEKCLEKLLLDDVLTGIEC